jgi:hypothetical protein
MYKVIFAMVNALLIGLCISLYLKELFLTIVSSLHF